MPEEMQRNPMGRPTLLTPELQEKICRMIRRGCYIEVAAEANGIAKETLFNWFRRGRSKDPADEMYRNFLTELNAAQAEAEMRDVGLLDALIHAEDADGNPVEGAKPNAGLLTWRLERRFPSRWGRAERVDVTAKVDATVTVDAMTPEERRARIAALQAKLEPKPE